MAGRAVISLFSGAMGLDLGLERAGFTIKVAVESNKFAAECIRLNRPDIALLENDIHELTTKEILEAAGLKVGEAAVITGGPSCQSFSTAGQRRSLTDPRGNLFKQFVRVVREAQPRFFVMENVRGILSAAVTHRPLAKRGPGFPALQADERLGSALQVILKDLRRLGYRVVFGILNAANFGVPQIRERVVFIGSRDGEDVQLPVGTYVRAKWITLRAALKTLDDPEPEHSTIPKGKAKFLKLVPAGGNWRDLPKALQRKALGRAYDSWGGRSGFCRRLSWKKPSPALTTRPDSKATILCHPTELRPLTIREYARLQQFPDDWAFPGGTPQKYRMIGNAVPVGLGEALGRSLMSLVRKRKPSKLKATVFCATKELKQRIKSRPRVILNPPRMRTIASRVAARRWIERSVRPRIRPHVATPSLRGARRTKPNPSPPKS